MAEQKPIRKPFPYPMSNLSESVVYWQADEAERYVEAIANARAEEVRREVIDAASKEIARLKGSQRAVDWITDAQRTAGGDAVHQYRDRTPADAPWYDADELDAHMGPAHLYESRTLYTAVQPVAEAAAQADDVSVIGGFGTTWPAAPTAQQTLPDDERAKWSFKQWWEHVGAWETPEGFVSFGSPMAVRAMLIQFGRMIEARAALRPPVALPEQIKYVPVDGSLTDKYGNHPNDNEPRTDACRAALDARGDNREQGLDPYWKWGFAAGFNAAGALPDAQEAAKPDFCDGNCTWRDHAPGCVRADAQEEDDDEPRAYTAEEARAEFIGHVQHLAFYWSRQEGTPRELLDGLTHSILCIFDGVTHLPAFDIVLAPHEDNKQYAIDNGDNWYEPGMVINDCHLHDMLYREDTQEAGKESK